MGSDGVQFVECDACGLGHSMRGHERMTPRQWALDRGWVTDVDGRDFCPRCAPPGRPLRAARVHEQLAVREMALGEVNIRIDYFHDSADTYLRMLGVDRSLLPSREEWRAFYRADYARPLEERLNYSLVWELDGEVVGFSSTDRIHFGQEAFMHLHILASERRRHGLGAAFVRLSARRYFEVLGLRRLYCEPNACNVAPNRALQQAGFRYVLSHEAQPSTINFPQVTTRWVLDAPP
jgi:RimJ/RimL family protein N-acetyltransferase